MENPPTELERRLNERISAEQPVRVRPKVKWWQWSTCQHEKTDFLTEIGSCVLRECPSCGMVLGIAI